MSASRTESGAERLRAHRRERHGAGVARPLALPIAPLIDVVFLLLLYFLLTSGLTDPGRLLRTVPERSDAAAARTADDPAAALRLEDETLVIRVTRGRGDGSVRMRIDAGAALGTPADPTELERVLRDALLGPANPRGLYAADHPLRIAAAGDVAWEDVVRVFRAAYGAGYRAIAFGGGGAS